MKTLREDNGMSMFKQSGGLWRGLMAMCHLHMKVCKDLNICGMSEHPSRNISSCIGAMTLISLLFHGLSICITSESLLDCCSLYSSRSSFCPSGAGQQVFWHFSTRQSQCHWIWLSLTRVSSQCWKAYCRKDSSVGPRWGWYTEDANQGASEFSCENCNGLKPCALVMLPCWVLTSISGDPQSTRV